MRRRTRVLVAGGIAVTVAVGVNGAAMASSASPGPTPAKGTCTVVKAGTGLVPGKPGPGGFILKAPQGDGKATVKNLTPSQAAEVRAKLEASGKGGAGKAGRTGKLPPQGGAGGCVTVGQGQDKVTAELAKKLGTTPQKVTQALGDLKRTVLAEGGSPTGTAAVQLFAKDLGISTGSAQSVLQQLFAGAQVQVSGGKVGPGKSLVGVLPEALVDDLAGQLGVTQTQARQALAQLSELGAQPGGVDPASAGFASVATSLGVSADRLGQALGQAKQDLAKDPSDPSSEKSSPSPSPKG